MSFVKSSILNGVKFTKREIDVIACIIHSRSAKKMSCILRISPRTVEGHVRNILSKLEKNSQESIRDFVENAPEWGLLRKHYLDLQMRNHSSAANKLQKMDAGLSAEKDGERVKSFQNVKIAEKALEYNKLLIKYSVPETVRNTLISTILVSLQDKHFVESFDQHKKNISLVKAMLQACVSVLEKNCIQDDRRDTILREYSNILNNQKLISTTIRDRNTKTDIPNVILRDLISDLKNSVLPLIAENDFDILGRFYTEFTKFAGNDSKTGLVLTPSHITELFCELANLQADDVVFDPCCGTGGFLVSAMKYMLNKSGNNIEELKKIRQDRLVGVEIRSDMFTQSCSNMMIRGEGRINIHNGDCFNKSIIELLKSQKPTKGFLNPPYDVGSDGQLEFVENTLKCLVKGGKCVAICQMSVAIRQDRRTIALRERLLKEHTLEAAFSMPDRLFYPVGVVTSILVFTAHIPHDVRKKVFFGFFKNDGHFLKKHKGRLDDGSWQTKKEYMLNLYRNSKSESGLSVTKSVTAIDEWCAEAYMETDYSKLTEADFIKTVKNYIAFQLLNLSDD